MTGADLHSQQRPQQGREKDLIIIYKYSYCAFAPDWSCLLF